MDKKEMLEKVRALQQLVSQRENLRSYCENGWKVDAKSKMKQMKPELSPLPGVPSVFNALPFFSEKWEKAQSAADKGKITGRVRNIAAVVAVVSFILAKWFHVMLCYYIFAIAAGIFLWKALSKHYVNQELAIRGEDYQKAEQEADDAVKAFRKALVNYPQEVTQGIAAAKNYGQFYRQKYQEYSKEFEQKKQEAQAQICVLDAQIAGHDYLPAEYHHLFGRIISLLESGSADSFDVILNQAIEEQREAEWQEAAYRKQLYEESLQRTLEEQRAARAEEQAAKAAEEAEERELYWARKKCQNCVNNNKCSSFLQINGGGKNCGGYRPRSRY